ncbi:uncharacterized protein LOC118646370 [Monomorium pharaonis]|uniref:uncharacterized protein LOC118646370 n=1 Tax=Monomorium pharaonis TaxID=307658 RepID=UPI00174782B0|nr:uncharacterized protein LOC118646370 [Monomorium pharaonis]
MNKKNYRLVGTLSSKESMQNLITDLKNAKSLLPSQTTSENSQSLIQSTSHIKKKPLTEINKTINYANTHVTFNTSIPSIKTSKNQSPEIYVTSTPHKKRTTNKNTFQLQESYNSENQISVPKNTFQIKSLRINNSQICDSLNKSIAEQTHIVHVVQDLFKKLNERLDIIEKKERYNFIKNYSLKYVLKIIFDTTFSYFYIGSENHAMLLRLTKIKNRRVKSIPKCLPFKSIQNLILFDNASDDIYNEVVDSILYCAAIYFKCAFEKVEKTTLEVTWHGTKDLKALKTTRFAHACEDAISNNLNFPKPRRDEFEDAMIKALKSTKERFRRQQKRPSLENDEYEEPFLRRARIPNKRQTGNTRNTINFDDARQQIDAQDNTNLSNISEQSDITEQSDVTKQSDITEQSDVIEQSLDYNPTIYNDEEFQLY